MRTHDQTVQEQFDAQAQAYLHSPVHSEGPDLLQAKILVEQALPRASEGVDVGCGAGHLSFALAGSLARLVALDPLPNMLATVTRAASSRGLTQIEARQATAESLPFSNDTFSLACTRYSAHHWRRLDIPLGEMQRILRPGGYVLIIDVLGDDDPLVDTHLQALELIRDPSHVRNRSQGEWSSALESAGFTDLQHFQWPMRLAFSAWVERMRTPADRVALIRALENGAPREVQAALAIEPDGSFAVRTGLFWARKAS
jgi:ubiquinone/menaquinone biosynthesis C-methylase UbiE